VRSPGKVILTTPQNELSPCGANSPRYCLLAISTILLSLLAQVPVQALPESMTHGELFGQNTLSLGTASGAPGSEITVPLGLGNEDVVVGIQLDVLFDPGVVSFSGGTVTERTAGMLLACAVQQAGRLRVVMYFAGGGTIPPGTGAVVDLVFHAIAVGTTALTPDGPLLSGPNGASLAVTATAGQIAVTEGGDPTGACCFTDLSCQILTAELCETQGGQHMGDGWPCEASTCLPVPISAKSWGGIKANYR
jgi:hypothetical protein